jgi:cytochrome c-type biogenesis protein CcmH
LPEAQNAYIKAKGKECGMDNWLFWAVAGATTLGVGLILLQALRQSSAASDDGAALKVYRDQLSEVDRDLARNVISAAEADRLRTEVSRRLLDADRALQNAAPRGGKGSALPATLLIALLLGAGLYAYDRLGAPGYADLPLATRLARADDTYRNRPSQTEAEAAAPAPEPVKTDPQFTELMTKLREVVKQRPDDPQGLALLAKNEAQLGNFTASRVAYQHLLQVKGDSASVNDHLGLAQTMIIAAGGFVSPEAEQQLILVLERDPKNPLARYFSGLMFAQVGRFDRAFALWEPLLREGPQDAPWMPPIRTGLQEVADRAGIKYQLPDAKGPTAGDIAAAGQMTPEDRQAMIAGMVGQLETRLYTDGGPLADWLKLMSSLMVLGDKPRATAAYEKAAAAFAGDTDALGQIEEAASAAGITP